MKSSTSPAAIKKLASNLQKLKSHPLYKKSLGDGKMELIISAEDYTEGLISGKPASTFTNEMIRPDAQNIVIPGQVKKNPDGTVKITPLDTTEYIAYKKIKNTKKRKPTIIKNPAKPA